MDRLATHSEFYTDALDGVVLGVVEVSVNLNLLGRYHGWLPSDPRLAPPACIRHGGALRLSPSPT